MSTLVYNHLYIYVCMYMYLYTRKECDDARADLCEPFSNISFTVCLILCSYCATTKARNTRNTGYAQRQFSNFPTSALQSIYNVSLEVFDMVWGGYD